MQTPMQAKFQLFEESAKKLGLQTRLSETSPWRLYITDGTKEHWISMQRFGLNKMNAVTRCRDKAYLHQIFKTHHIPCPRNITFDDVASYSKHTSEFGFPHVLKPLFGQQGDMVFPNITSQAMGEEVALSILNRYHRGLIEEYCQGSDYRFIVLAGEVIGACHRVPSVLRGDGLQTIESLILAENNQRHQHNQKLGKKIMPFIPLAHQLTLALAVMGLTPESILAAGQEITPYPVANASKGGLVQTVAVESFHPSILAHVQKVARLTQLTFTGIDVLIKKIDDSSRAANVAFLEVNTNPSIRIHEWPNTGPSQPISEKILHHVFKIN